LPLFLVSMVSRHEKLGSKSTVEDRRAAWGVSVKVHRSRRLASMFESVRAGAAARGKIAVLQHDKRILQKLVIAAQVRSFDMKELVGNHELNLGSNVFFKPNGDMNLPGNKAVMKAHFATTTPTLPEDFAITLEDTSLAVLIDGNAFLQMIGKPKEAVTFKDCSQAFIRSVMRRFTAHGAKVDRLDVCFDRYREFTIKDGTRYKRVGKEKKSIPCTMPRHDLRITANWDAFIRLEDNKRNYVRHLAQSLREHCQDDAGKLAGVVFTAGGFETAREAYCSDPTTPLEFLQRDDEEADTRLLRHVQHAKRRGKTAPALRAGARTPVGAVWTGRSRPPSL